MRRLPPLRSLQAFDAAARHASFKAAAEELFITPTAISHLIKSLEDQLQVRLFNRLTRSVSLTAEGQALVPYVREAFGAFERGLEALSAESTTGMLCVTTTMAFASCWLAPRLPSFSAEHSQLEVRIIASDNVLDFNRHNVDVAVRHGRGDYKDLHACWILDDFVAPVCNPTVAAQLLRDQPSSALGQQLLAYEWHGFTDADPSWQRWLEAAGVSVRPRIAATFSEEHMCLAAAEQGDGLAFVSLLAAGEAIKAGRLIVPFDLILKDRSYFLVYPPERKASAKIQAFETWLLDEADAFRETTIGQRLDRNLHVPPR